MSTWTPIMKISKTQVLPVAAESQDGEVKNVAGNQKNESIPLTSSVQIPHFLFKCLPQVFSWWMSPLPERICSSLYCFQYALALVIESSWKDCLWNFPFFPQHYDIPTPSLWAIFMSVGSSLLVYTYSRSMVLDMLVAQWLALHFTFVWRWFPPGL